MALTHVMMWSRTGWKHVTIEDVERLHPGGKVSARSGLFRCELCGQMVSLAEGPIKGRFFKHSRGDQNKACPERETGDAGTYTIEKHPSNLPFRLDIISNQAFLLKIGIVLFPEVRDCTGTLYIRSVDNSISYQYSVERLSVGQITYLPVGDHPARQYRLSFTDSVMQRYYPNMTSGINPTGVMFDGETGKRLPEDADTIVDHKYYLLTTSILYEHHYQTIKLKHILSQFNWKVYEVRANTLSMESAEFFFGFSCRLTETPVQLIPVWPLYLQSPYILYHLTEQMYFYMSGQNITQRTFPNADVALFQCAEDGKSVFQVHCQERQQLISVGRIKVLRYTYLWKSDEERTAELPLIEVTDLMGNLRPNGTQHLPEKQILCVKAPYDGEIQVSKNGFVIEKYKLFAEHISEIEGLQYGQEVKILQGMDCVYHAMFQRNAPGFHYSDETLYRNLERAGGKEIHISHRLGSIAADLDDFPKVRLWLAKRIRNGTMKENAYQMLLETVRRMKND